MVIGRLLSPRHIRSAVAVRGCLLIRGALRVCCRSHPPPAAARVLCSIDDISLFEWVLVCDLLRLEVGMRGAKDDQTELFCYFSLESRVPDKHPLRDIRELCDAVLGRMDRSLGRCWCQSPFKLERRLTLSKTVED